MVLNKMRATLIAANWKMNTTVNEAIDLVNKIIAPLSKIDNVEKVICPPFISLKAVADIIRGSSL